MGEWVVTGRRPVAGVLSAAAAAAGFLGIALGLPAVAADTSGASASTSEARKLARGEGGDAAAMPSLWSTTARLRGGVGVKDNPQLSTLNAQSSGFASLAAEVSSLRIPLDGPEVALFGTVEHTEYYQDELEPETVGLADARWEGSIADDWSLTAQGGYVFLRQVFDASEIEGVPFVVRAEGHAGSLKPGV